MKRLLSVSVLVGLCLSVSSCVTPRDQVAVVRGAKFAAAEGSALGAAVGAELAQVAADIGAVQLDAQGAMLPADVDPAAVPVEIAAAEANAQGIASERESRNWFLAASKSVLDWAGANWPPLGAALGLAGAVAALWKKLRGANAALGAARIGLTAGVTLFQRAKEALADGKLSLDDFKRLFAEAQTAGPAFVDGAHQLEAVYQQLKAEWSADGTPIRSASSTPTAGSPN